MKNFEKLSLKKNIYQASRINSSSSFEARKFCFIRISIPPSYKRTHFEFRLSFIVMFENAKFHFMKNFWPKAWIKKVSGWNLKFWYRRLKRAAIWLKYKNKTELSSFKTLGVRFWNIIKFWTIFYYFFNSKLRNS